MLLRGKKRKNKSACGILLALSSLPSADGIGTLGKEAYRFIDFLKDSGQSYWQMLPLCPLGKGNSPYCSASSFAGEILYIDIELLVEAGWLSVEDISEKAFPQRVDYSAVRKYKLPLLKKAAEVFDINSKDFLKFKRENKFWLKDYALFMAIKESLSGAELCSWDDAYKYRMPNALLTFEDMHPEEILFYEITQYFFFTQYRALKAYAELQGISLIGDIPFYVSLDSADVWSRPEGFRLGRDMTPVLVAGVPPDSFSDDGQLWGNPVYDWVYHKKTDYLWWRKRLMHMSEMYDVIRIDHFRAFADYYTIPYGAETAKIGKWEKGAGIGFWEAVRPYIKHTEIIAEDLGGDTEEVRALIEKTGFPDMKVLQFAFNTDLKNPFLPRNFGSECVCYTGTHDNDTTFGWYEKADLREKLLFSRLVPSGKESNPVFDLIGYAMRSRAYLVIIPFQDYLCLSSADRMNTPGTESGNWEWRFSSDSLTDGLCEDILRLSALRKRPQP